ncbi:MAG: twin-arginine translocase subunit TatC [Phycisphaerales bacterium]
MGIQNFIAGQTVEALMPLGSHLDELRKRLIWALAGLLPILIVSMIFGAEILDFLTKPVERALEQRGFPGTLVSIGPTEAFTTYMEVGVIATIAVGLPWVLYQLWLFVAPGLYHSERRYVYLLLPLSSTLMLGSMAFLYQLVLPLVLSFFVDFGVSLGARTPATIETPTGMTFLQAPVLPGDPTTPKSGEIWINSSLRAVRICVGERDGKPDISSLKLTKEAGIRPEYRVTEYIGLLRSLTLAFAAGFQTPVVVLLLGWAGFITPAFLNEYRKHAVFVTAIVAALLTPGDVSTMLLLWIPLYLLYELGGFLLRVFPSERVARGLSSAGAKNPEDKNPEDENPL